MITNSEIVGLYEDCTKLLTYVGNANVDTEEMLESIDNLKKITKRLSLAEKLMNENIVCITGRQGAGKTTFVRNFLGLSSDYFYIDDGECELVPVFIKGKSIKDVEMRCEFLDIKEMAGKKYYIRNSEIIESPEKFKQLAGRRDYDGREILSLELSIPDENMKLGNLTFLLLPGHVGDVENEDIDNMIELSIAGSDTAIYVLHPNDLPDRENNNFMRSVLDRFREKAIFLITWSDKYMSGTVAEYRNACKDKLGLSDISRVVPVGAGNENEWADIVWESLNKHMKSGIQANMNMLEYMKKIVRREVRPNIKKIREELKESETAEVGETYQNDILIKMFDEEKEKLKKRYERSITQELNKSKKTDEDKLLDIIQKENKGFIKRVFLKASLSDVKNMREMLDRAMRSSEGNYNYQKAMVNAIASATGATIEDENSNILSKDEDVIEADFRESGNDGDEINITRKQAMVENAVMLLSNDNYGEIIMPRTIKNDNNAFLEENMKVTCQLGSSYLATALLAGVGDGVNGSSIKLKNSEITLSDMKKNITESQKFLVGVLGVGAADIVGDGVLDLIPNLARALEGVLQTLFPALNPNLVKGGILGAGKEKKAAEVAALSSQVATSVACGVIGVTAVAGIARSVYIDVNNLKINDYFSGCQLIESSYKEIKQAYLEVFDEYMDEIKNRILKHLRAKDSGSIRDYYGYNARVVLDRIERKVERLYEEMNDDDLRKFEAQISRCI